MPGRPGPLVAALIDDRVAILGQHGRVGLLGEKAGFKRENAAADLLFYSYLHFVFLPLRCVPAMQRARANVALRLAAASRATAPSESALRGHANAAAAAADDECASHAKRPPTDSPTAWQTYLRMPSLPMMSTYPCGLTRRR